MAVAKKMTIAKGISAAEYLEVQRHFSEANHSNTPHRKRCQFFFDVMSCQIDS
jgi:hypothetical protein